MIRCLAITCLVFFARNAHAQQKPNDLRRMEGTWEMIALEINGEKIPDDKIANTQVEIKNGQYIVKIKNKVHKANITLDPKKKPKWIDMTPQDGPNKDQVMKGIYSLKGDTLIICRGLQMDQERPTEFTTSEGSNLFVVTWRRKK